MIDIPSNMNPVKLKTNGIATGCGMAFSGALLTIGKLTRL
jgi:hypothetical protein